MSHYKCTAGADFEVAKVFSDLSSKDKIALLAGSDFWHTTPLPKHGVPKIRMSDGSSGIRGTRWFEGVQGAAIPCGTALAATWDRGLLRQAGILLGEESRAKGAQCWLGPTINIQRSPLGGRGYESYSEDPHLTGILASEIIRGCESTGVISTIKHLVCNDQEDQKRAVSALMTERALREIYLRPFQIAARDAKPGACMTSYNKVNGIHVSESKHILHDIVRKEWKWDPLIMSDWCGTFSVVEAINAGLDLEMPGESVFRGQLLNLASTANLLKTSTMDERALRVLRFIKDAAQVTVSPEESQRNLPEDRALNLDLAQSSIVLLKNHGDILPIPKTVKKIALIGSHMKDCTMNSIGATALEPYYTVHPFEGILGKLGLDVDVKYEVGAHTHKMLPQLTSRTMDNIHLYFYNEPVHVASRECVGDLALSKTFFSLLDYVNPDLNPSLFYCTMEGDFTPDESGTWDFGLAVYGTATLYINDEPIVDNSTVQRPGGSFFDQGTAEELGTFTVEAGKTYKIRVEFGSAATSTLTPVLGSVDFDGGGARLGACPQASPKELIQRAVEVARCAEYAVICTGLNGEWETEGHDRSSMDLPNHVDEMIARVAEAWYAGNETGSSIANVLFGDFNPCGKMPISWPKRLRDNPTYLNWGTTNGRVLFGEDVFVGYRWFDKMEIEPLWKFGHGLSYTKFSLSSPSLGPISWKDGRINATVSLKVKNIGPSAGAEIIQLYVSPREPTLIRPVQELHGFEKVLLQPNEEKQVAVVVDPYAMSYWDECEEKWRVDKGKYAITVTTGAPKVDVLVGEIEVEKTLWWLGV
ncbi:beta-glucosidase [Colletotrichum tabaci]|uniref:Probable beta-glucosidase H n=1 Tax=Colletotrichum tabaci TaxID=1209068 RepID=A0AAV9TVA8_9PEZI